MQPEHIYEIIEEVQKAKTKKDKLAVLKARECWPLKDLLMGTYSDKIQWNLPEGTPPYTPNIPSSIPSTFLRLNKNLKFFVKGGPGDKMASYQREGKFLQMLESVHPVDAQLLVGMINKKPIEGITKAVAKEAFPDLIV